MDGRDAERLNTPEPTQDVHREDGNASPGSDTGESLLCAWFAVREAVTADHNGDETCDLGDRTCKQGLQGW